jgi:hypothetical protein
MDSLGMDEWFELFASTRPRRLKSTYAPLYLLDLYYSMYISSKTKLMGVVAAPGGIVTTITRDEDATPATDSVSVLCSCMHACVRNLEEVDVLHRKLERYRTCSRSLQA